MVLWGKRCYYYHHIYHCFFMCLLARWLKKLSSSSFDKAVTFWQKKWPFRFVRASVSTRVCINARISVFYFFRFTIFWIWIVRFNGFSNIVMKYFQIFEIYVFSTFTEYVHYMNKSNYSNVSRNRIFKLQLFHLNTA